MKKPLKNIQQFPFPKMKIHVGYIKSLVLKKENYLTRLPKTAPVIVNLSTVILLQCYNNDAVFPYMFWHFVLKLTTFTTCLSPGNLNRLISVNSSSEILMYMTWQWYKHSNNAWKIHNNVFIACVFCQA